MIEQVKMGVASVAKSFSIDMYELLIRPNLYYADYTSRWLARHTPEKVLPTLHKVLTSVKEEFADAVANGGGIYAVGYCFGAKYVLLLGSSLDSQTVEGAKSPESQAEEGTVKQGPQIKCGAIAHGTQISQEEMEGMRVPVCIVAVEDDSLFPDEVREAGKKGLEARKAEFEVSVYPGVPHGFAVLGDYEDQKIVKAQGEAFLQMLGWLKAH